MQRGTTWQMIGVVCLAIFCAVGGILLYLERQRHDAQEIARLQDEVQFDSRNLDTMRTLISGSKPEVDSFKDALYILRRKQARLRDLQMGIDATPLRSDTDREADAILQHK